MKESIIIYKSMWEAIELLPTEIQQNEAMRLLMNYGFRDIAPQTNDPCIQEIINKAIATRSKGGRPEKVADEEILELRAKGYTQKQIAGALSVDVSTVQRRLAKKRITPQNNAKPFITPDTVKDADEYIAEFIEREYNTYIKSALEHFKRPLTEDELIDIKTRVIKYTNKHKGEILDNAHKA